LIDLTSDMPVELSNQMPGELRVELRIEVPTQVPSVLPIELSIARFSLRLGCASGRERMGECGADACWGCCWLSGLKLRCKRMWGTSCESGRTRESADRCRCFCR